MICQSIIKTPVLQNRTVSMADNSQFINLFYKFEIKVFCFLHLSSKIDLVQHYKVFLQDLNQPCSLEFYDLLHHISPVICISPKVCHQVTLIILKSWFYDCSISLLGYLNHPKLHHKKRISMLQHEYCQYHHIAHNPKDL